MTTMSVSVPTDLRKRMMDHEEINWSAIARKAFEGKVEEIEFLQKVAQKSKLTAKDAQEISDKISKSVARKFRGK